MGKKKVTRKKASSHSKIESAIPFEQALSELELAVAELESGELGLDDSLARYEQGVSRLKRCHEALEHARRRIEVLSGVDAEGNPVSKPFDAGGAPVDEGDRLF